MASEDTKSLSASYAMTGGDGPSSYARNSFYQKGIVDAAKEAINEGIKNKLDFNYECFHTINTFRIADFGCAAGPNTFFSMQNIIEAVKCKYDDEHRDHPPLEFQVFFNDHTTNDFNTLFRALTPYQNYFAAGVPGSFYQRLFPKSSINLGHTSYALHWLSKVPDEVVDPTSPAWNKGSIQCTGTVEAVNKAYYAQFANDLDRFLNARAEEIVGSGLMVIIIGGLPEGVLMSQTATGACYDSLGACLMNMAQLGVIDAEKVESFNLPLYYSSAKELEEIIHRNGHFSIEKMDTLDNPIMHMKVNAAVAAHSFKAVFEGVVKEHFGDGAIMDEIFRYFYREFVDKFSHIEKISYHVLDRFLLLKRKINH